MDRHEELLAGLTRRRFLEQATLAGLGALVASALPAVERARAAATPVDLDGTLQAFADTMIPGRRIARTAFGAAVHPRAVLGRDPEPGAVEADALALYHHKEIGFDTLAPAFLADLQARSLSQGGPFLSLGWDGRVATCIAGLSFDNPDRLLWEAAAAVPFTAFCAAALVPEQTAKKAVGYRVMGLPGRAPNGYAHASYKRKLARERTKRGSLS